MSEPAVLPVDAVPTPRRQGHSTLRPLTNWLLLVMVIIEVLFLGGLLISRGENNPVVTIGLSLATQWVPVAIFWVVAVRTRFARLEIILAAAGVTLSAIGDSYYTLAMDSEGFLAFPSPADAGYLLFYPLMVGALVVLVRRQRTRATVLVLLEGAVACVGAAAVLAVVLDPVIAAALAGDNALDGAIAVSYPLFDLVLLAAMAGIAASPGPRISPRWWSLFVGLSIFVVADIAYALLEHEGAYIAGTPLDASWAIGLAFITWWAVGLDRSTDAAARQRTRPYAVPVAAIAVLAGLAVLIFGTQAPISTLALVLAAATVALAAVPIIFRQAVLGRIVAVQDQEVHQLTDLDLAKTDMMITMNHEFRTPLTSINGYVELLLDGDGGELPAGAVKMMRVIEGNAARLQDLVDDLLTMSKLEAGGSALESAPAYLAGIMHRAADSLTPLASTRGVRVSVECDFTPVVDGDASQLERAFADLIENAVKFTAAGGSVRVLATADTSAAEPIVVVRVVDTGIGIPVDEVPQLFTRFFRASNAKDAAVPGVGLGLAIVRATVEAHRGRITAESTIGEGTTIKVELPLSPLTLTAVREPSP
ncbi:MAG: sensor histidine kinase [Rhodoglobus sp.]|nr:sensor histidine kinase [Rhodoglobus sp.]